MPYPNPSLRATIDGTLAGGEIFATSFGLSAPGLLSQDDLNTCAINVESSFANVFLTNTIKSLYPASTVFGSVVVYQYEGGTKASMVSVRQALGIAGTDSNQALPNQCALVATLNTGVPGRANRGRMYLPPMGVDVMSGGQVLDSVIAAVASALAETFTALSQQPAPGPFKAQVISLAHSAMRPVTSVSIDSRMDVQRRRANSQSISHRESSNV